MFRWKWEERQMVIAKCKKKESRDAMKFLKRKATTEIGQKSNIGDRINFQQRKTEADIR